MTRFDASNGVGLDVITPCMRTDPEIFFPEPGRGLDEQFISDCVTALVLCNECPVRQKCLEYSMEVTETVQYGIYGGTLAHERKIAAGFYEKQLPRWINRVRVQTEALGIKTPKVPVPKEKPKPCISIGEKFNVFHQRPDIDADLSLQEW